MSDNSTIEWTDSTWNPTRGCTKISPGCKNCYAETFAERFKGVDGHPYELGFAPRTAPSKLHEPLTWRKPRRIFVNSMSDLFHEAFADEYIDEVLAVMLLGHWHTYQVLTKRAERMATYLNDPKLYRRVLDAANRIRFGRPGLLQVGVSDPSKFPAKWIWWGVSVEDQLRAEERIPHLLRTPAAVRFLSCEPLLGEVNLTRLHDDEIGARWNALEMGIHWVIVGGESGRGARPFDLSWARSIVEQCKGAGVACFVKQLGAKPLDSTPLETKLDELIAGARGPLVIKSKKGGDMSEWPMDLRVREFPVRHV